MSEPSKEAIEAGEHKDPEYPAPTPDDLSNPVFEAIWQAIKGWDISRYKDGLYSGPTGNDVMHILNRIHEPPTLAEAAQPQRSECEQAARKYFTTPQRSEWARIVTEANGVAASSEPQEWTIETVTRIWQGGGNPYAAVRDAHNAALAAERKTI